MAATQGFDSLGSGRSEPWNISDSRGAATFEERDAALQLGALDFTEMPLDFEKPRADLKGCQCDAPHQA